jgi:hypothetical protein
MRKKIIPPGIEVPGATEFERFRNLTREVLAIPKAEIARRELEWRKERKKHTGSY